MRLVTTLVFILFSLLVTTESYNPYRGQGAIRRGYGRSGPPPEHKAYMQKLAMKRGLRTAAGSESALENLMADIQANPQKLQQAVMNGMTPQFLSQAENILNGDLVPAQFK